MKRLVYKCNKKLNNIIIKIKKFLRFSIPNHR